jgi:hypothetical protein
MTRQFGDIRLQQWPVSDGFKWIVQPASRDAVIGLMWRHVMDTVVFTWQDYMQILHEGDVPWKSKICVGIFMYLDNEKIKN